VRSNPTLADTDNDGFTDGEELAASGLWSTDPSRADSDGDRMLDRYDPQPNEYTKISNKGFIVLWAVEMNAPGDTPTIIVIPAEIPDATSVEYEFEVELVPIADDFCADDSCYVPVALTSAFGTSPTLAFFGWILQDTVNDGKPDYKYRYRVYIKINGSPRLLIDELSIDTAVAKQALTVNVQNLYVKTCLDGWTFADSGNLSDASAAKDQSCELYWTVSINGVKYDGQELANEPPDAIGRSELDKISAVTGSTLAINTPVTLDVPAESCFDVQLEVWESDSTNPNNNTGDDKLITTQTVQHCPNGGWKSGTPQTISARYYRYGSSIREVLAEDISAELTYTVTVP